MDNSTVRRGYFAVLPANVRYNPELRANAKLLYSEITALLNEDGNCFVSNEYFAQLYEVSTSAISAWLTNLQRCGYIQISINHRTNVRKISLVQLNGGSEEDCAKSSTRMREIATPIISNNNTKDNNKELSKEREKTPKRAPLIVDPKISSGKTKDQKAKDKSRKIVQMREMLNAVSENAEVRYKLMEYFSFRLGRKLEPDQWKIILDDLVTYANGNEKIMIQKIRGATAAGYMSIVASWELGEIKRVAGRKFDNTAGEVCPAASDNVNFNEELARDDNGDLITF